MNLTSTIKKHNLQSLSHEMRMSAWYDGPHYWNTATAVSRLYVPTSRWARFVRWISA